MCYGLTLISARNSEMAAFYSIMTIAGLLLHTCFGLCPEHVCSSLESMLSQVESCSCAGSHHVADTHSDDADHENSPHSGYPCNHEECSISAFQSDARGFEELLVVTNILAIEATIVSLEPTVQSQEIETFFEFRSPQVSRIKRCVWLI